LNLWNQQVAVGVWLQNIDSRDLRWKISEMNNLRDLRRQKRIPSHPSQRTGRDPGSGMTERKAAAKGKAAQMARPSFQALYIYCIELSGINMS
jgi:hypothetical protein